MVRGKIAYGRKGLVGDESDASLLAVTGAGNALYLEDVHKEFINGPYHGDIAQLKNRTTEWIKTFYNDHVIPFGYGASQRPDVSLIFAGRHKGAQVLLSTTHNVVTEVYDCCAVGIGEMYANILLQQLFCPMDIVSAICIASYVVFQVKEHVDGCGNDTDIVVLSGNKMSFVQRSVAKELEGLFMEYVSIEGNLLHFVFGREQRPEKELAHALMARIQRLRKAAIKLLYPSKATRSLISQA